MSFERDLDVAIRARCTLVVVFTVEEERLLEQVRDLCARQARPLAVWDAAEGFGASAPKPAKDPLSALEQAESLPADALVVLRDFHDFWNNPLVRRKLRNVASRLRGGRRGLLVTAPGGRIPDELRDEALVIEFGLPGADELRRVVEGFCATPALKVSLTGLAREKLVSAAAGLTTMQLRRQLSRAIVEHGALDDRHISWLADAKRQLLRDHEALEYFPVSETCDDVGGLDSLKAWLRSRERAFTSEARQYGLPSPRGMALLGIPGTGKSLSARIVAGMWRMPLIRLDVGALFGSLVGESEERVRRALRVAEAIAPCVLWIDELEKAMAAGASDGGTSARVLATILTWMQEKTAPCFVVATANQVDALPPELLRRGRFDEIFFVDLPTTRERREILEVHLRKRGRLPVDFDVDRLSVLSEGFVGAELEQAVLDAMFAGFNEGREFTSDDMEGALRRLVPLSISHREDVKALRAWLHEGRARSATFGESLEAARRSVPLRFDDLVKEN